MWQESRLHHCSFRGEGLPHLSQTAVQGLNLCRAPPLRTVWICARHAHSARRARTPHSIARSLPPALRQPLARPSAHRATEMHVGTSCDVLSAQCVAAHAQSMAITRNGNHAQSGPLSTSCTAPSRRRGHPSSSSCRPTHQGVNSDPRMHMSVTRRRAST